jgi:Pao retrotransposon peptidase/Protein of unknown function (DUF1759)/Family of unknown function (DUF5641)/Integrase zinc binding domain
LIVKGAMADKKDDTEPERRRTKRPNAGVPASWYGDVVNYERMKNKKAPPPSQPLGEESGHASSRGTEQTSSSKIQMKELEAQTNKEIDKLDATQDEAKKDVELLKIDIKELKNQIEFHEQCAAEEEDEEARKEKVEGILRARASMDRLQIDLDRATVHLQFQEKELERKKRQIREDAEVEKLKLDEEDNPRPSSPIDKYRDVSNWAASSAAFNQHDDEDRDNFSKCGNLSGPSIPQQDPYSLQDMTQALTNVLRASTTRSPSNTTSNRMMARQLQGRDLPHFSGRPEDWPAFIAAYNTSTANCQFNNAENLTRLQRCLKGEASRSVQCLLIEPEGVPHALQKLEMRFGRPVVIIESLIQKVRDVPSVKSDRPETFIDFGVSVDNLVAMIKALKKPEHLANPTLIHELTKKLPPMTQIDWMQTQTSDCPTLEEFSTWVSKYTDAACKLYPPKQITPESSKHDRKQIRKPHERVCAAAEGGAGSSSGGQNQRKNNEQRKCPTCSKPGHTTQGCISFTNESVKRRWEIVKEKRMCFGCLNLGHRFGDCRSKKTCAVGGCKLQHHKLLHDERPSRVETTNRVQEGQEDEERVNEVVKFTSEIVNTTTSHSHINHLMIPCLLRGEEGLIVKGYAVLDNYSSITAIEDKDAKHLKLEGKSLPLTVKGFNTTNSFPESRAVKITIASTEEDFQVTLNNVRTVKKLNLSKQSVPKSTLKKWSHLEGVPIHCYDNARPTILIGLDNPELHLQLEHRKSPNPNAPIAVKTLLGWMLMGRMGPYEKSDFAYFMKNDDIMHEMIKEHFSIESVGIKPSLSNPRSREDIRAQEILDSTLRRHQQRWEVGLLWKYDDFKLPNSKPQAISRLKLMERKMDRDPDFARQYCQRIQEYESKGFARRLTPQEAEVENSKTFYLPHFMAYNPKKPKKLRFVFDAAAKVGGKSLNDYLLQGPDKLNSLPGILLRFRQRVVGVTADIQDMFHRVMVRKEDVHSQRFLWRGMDRDRDPDVWEMGVLIFGGACSPCCAQEAKNRNSEEFIEEFPEAHNSIVYNHYVDDLLDSCDTATEAIALQQEICEVHSRGGFRLCNWLSNSKEVMQAIPEDLQAATMKNLDVGSEIPPERVLGLFWKPQEDEFTFSLTFLKAQADVLGGEKIPTKRELLSLHMSIYDPLGFLSILTMKSKLIIQRTWSSKVQWDEKIPESAIGSWRKWLEEINQIHTFRLPRCYSSLFSTAQSRELHIFSDASTEAYGAVAYLSITRGNATETSLVMAKSKVCPVKELSMPRLELQSAVIGARLAKFITEEMKFPIHRTIFWSDSTTVISWIRSEGKRFQSFVSHRVGEIWELTKVEEWKWLPTDQNVADELTRSANPCNWSPTSRWINGPAWLRKSEEYWPKEKSRPPNQADLEEKRQVLKLQEVVNPIQIERFSKWWRLIRATAFLLRYVKKLQKKSAHNGEGLGVDEIAEAEMWWWRKAQHEMYAEEIQAIKNQEPIGKRSKLHNISLMLDNFGILRVRGRLDNANIPTVMKQPVILPAKHPLTKLIVLFYHTFFGHHGHEKIGNELRQMFYIPSLRNAVKRAQHECQVCKNSRATPKVPEMGQLPKFRLESNVYPFQNTGLDYFGPVEVVVKRSRVKRYVALFTCLSTRAIHLEVADSLTTSSCLMAIRRFVGRRGCPNEIHSDNGTNFVGANSELKKCLDQLQQDSIHDELSTRGIKWNFICPAASHMGGSWERMVRSVKVALGAVLQSKSLSDEVLHTLIVEAEHTVNCHPLTHVPDDPSDNEALTPNHFLIGRSSNLQPWGEFTRDDLFGRKQWRIAQQMADQFWRRWIKEFLPTLLRRQKWCSPNRPIQIDDVVK